MTLACLGRGIAAVYSVRRPVHNSATLLGPKKATKLHGSKWRISQGMGRSGNEYGVLTDMPDYSFLDGRPTPLTARQVKRRQDRIDTTKSIMEQLGQIEFARDRFQKNEEEKLRERQSILAQKLKPKS